MCEIPPPRFARCRDDITRFARRRDDIVKAYARGQDDTVTVAQE